MWSGLPHDPLFSFLDALGYSHYYAAFGMYGIETLADVGLMEDCDFETLQVKPFHKKKIRLALAQQPDSSSLLAANGMRCDPLFPWVENVATSNLDLIEDVALEEDAVTEESLKDEIMKQDESLKDEIMKQDESLKDEIMKQDEIYLRELLASERNMTMNPPKKSREKDTPWTYVGNKKKELERQQLEEKRQKERQLELRRQQEEEDQKRIAEEEERIRLAEEEKKRQERERRRREAKRAKQLVKKPVTPPPPKQSKKKKPKPPKNLCLLWKTKGECSYLLAGKKCEYDHPEEWRGERSK
jgi:hypothetical protein